MAMAPEDYEEYVADLLATAGWQARVTPRQRDFGLDIICDKPDRRLGVQVKMYGAGSRAVNGQMIMQLHGAAALQDCQEAMLVTDGRVLGDAQRIADKLGIEIRFEEVPEAFSNPRKARDASGANTPMTFDAIWEEHVVPLTGSELAREDGKTNEILSVDWSGLKRRTSNGKSQTIAIEIFRWTIERLLDGETVFQQEINNQYPKRASAGIVLVLSSLPMFEKIKCDGRMAVRFTAEL